MIVASGKCPRKWLHYPLGKKDFGHKLFADVLRRHKDLYLQHDRGAVCPEIKGHHAIRPWAQWHLNVGQCGPVTDNLRVG